MGAMGKSIFPEKIKLDRLSKSFYVYLPFSITLCGKKALISSPEGAEPFLCTFFKIIA